MDPLVALAYYMTYQSQRLESLTYNTDPTVKMLHSILHKMVTKGGAKIKKKVMVNQFLEDTESKLQEIVDFKNVESEAVIEKRNTYIKEVLNNIEKMKRKIEDDDGAQEDKNATLYSSDDFLFIETISTPGKQKNWKSIYDEGKSKNLFQSYTSPSPLKSSYFQARKRIKDQAKKRTKNKK